MQMRPCRCGHADRKPYYLWATLKGRVQSDDRTRTLLVNDSQGKYEEALESHETALAPDSVWLDAATSCGSIGNFYDTQAQYEQAFDYYQESLDIQIRMVEATMKCFPVGLPHTPIRLCNESGFLVMKRSVVDAHQ
jgi:tetratricopeptide (TPR) repeat protein